MYNYCANTSSTNLNKLAIDTVKSQISDRAKCIKYAKWFAEKNNLTWNDDIKPFSTYVQTLVNYSVNLMHRYLKENKDDTEVLLRFFGDHFGGNGLLYYLYTLPSFNLNHIDSFELQKEIETIHKSTSWKITKPLRWTMRKIRGY
jgi:hypothetical protein